MVSSADCAGLEKELILVDDGSVDGTREILQTLDADKYSARVFFHERIKVRGRRLEPPSSMQLAM